jgi:uncharacterized membrane protein
MSRRFPYLNTRTGRIFATLAAALALVTAAGLFVLWPSDATEPTLAAGLAGGTERAEVLSVSSRPCPPPQPGECVEAKLRLESGDDEGQTVTLALGSGPQVPDLEPGDRIRVASVPSTPLPGASQTGTSQTAPEGSETTTAYTFVDFERRSPMLWLAIAFVALVIVVARLRGVLSLVGLGISLGVVLGFIVPAILDGESPLAVAVVGAMAVMLVTISLAHGLGAKSLAAIVGTAASLLLVAGLASAFTELTHLTGLSSEEATLLQFQGLEVDFQGLLLAGMVIGALGVLDDVTVSQASTVMALRAANPSLGFGQLYRRALVVGRDHVSATVNTLVLAYVGSSLPVLLIFSSGGVSLIDAVNVELVAKEIVATLVGSIGLIAAVPLTTAIAGLLAGGLSPDTLRSGGATVDAH